jgi:hypothetical protein
MFTLLKRCNARDLAFVQAPSFVAALLIAELFYKFHSFLLETSAFLLTWLVLDAAITGAALFVRRRDGRDGLAPTS